ncbi:hypothetical protein [Cohnella cholangitidis]|uniref:Sporulation membrane protein YtrI C-terminal domain-containing protein n=1 Tax=Cohnella cholangitidis TaxID=2598458 RepID=A0A7G5BUX1_9BACL|nr:hypothetical protein [Cohnella cholangitidis]QMV40755.1 hypothetical protein FPL14_05715 [Cohnella cholangitidis]
MRVPTFERFQRFMQVTAFFVCGMIVGSAVYNALKINVVNEVIQKNYELKDQLETIKTDLELAQQVRKENVIRNIVTIFRNDQGNSENLDIMTEKELKRRLKEDLNIIFLGRNIYTINTDAEVARKLLNKKVYDHVEDQDYEVTIRTMLLVDGVLQVWVEAKKHLNK